VKSSHLPPPHHPSPRAPREAHVQLNAISTSFSGLWRDSLSVRPLRVPFSSKSMKPRRACSPLSFPWALRFYDSDTRRKPFFPMRNFSFMKSLFRNLPYFFPRLCSEPRQIDAFLWRVFSSDLAISDHFLPPFESSIATSSSFGKFRWTLRFVVGYIPPFPFCFSNHYACDIDQLFLPPYSRTSFREVRKTSLVALFSGDRSSLPLVEPPPWTSLGPLVSRARKLFPL